MSKRVSLENENVTNIFFGTLDTPFSTKCNVRPLMRVLLIFKKIFFFEGGRRGKPFFFTVTISRLMITKRRRFGKNKLGALFQSRLALIN